jgi:hypothetical protein
MTEDAYWRARARRWKKGHRKGGPTWTVEELARAAKIAFPRGCAYCGRHYGHTKATSFTLDSIGENMAMGYPHNVVFCCGSCNSSRKCPIAEWIARRPVLPWAVEDRRQQFIEARRQ